MTKDFNTGDFISIYLSKTCKHRNNLEQKLPQSIILLSNVQKETTHL